MTEQKRGRGQPRKGTERKIVIPDSDWEEIGRRATSENVPRAEIVRRAIRAYLT